MTDDTTAVARMYSTRWQAEFGRMLLSASGIESFIRADDSGGWRPYLAPVTGVRLVVRTADQERAREVLAESQSEQEQTDGRDTDA